MSRKRTLFAIASSAAVLGSVFLTAAPASAGAGSCKSGDVCFYYNSGQGGAKYGLGGPRGHYDGLTFKGGKGNGTPLKNNAASVYNMNKSQAVTIYYNSWWDCRTACQHIPPMNKANLGRGMKNENASHDWYSWKAPH